MFKKEQEHYGELGENYWWLGGKYDIIVDLMKRHRSNLASTSILDVGCGPGNMFNLLKPFGVVSGMDFSEDALRLAKDKGYKELQYGKAEQIPYADESFDIVVALDIIEHVPDDREAIKEIFRVLKPGGKLFFSLPAYMFLWGDHDDMYGHYRRYTKTEIRRKMENGGFVTKQISYVEPVFLLPLLVFRRLKKKMKTQKDDFVHLPGFLNTFLRHFIGAEKYILRVMSIPFGVSIVGVVEKKL